MNMFKSFLDAIPKNRSDYVNNLDLEHIILEPFVWTESDDSLKSDSLLSESMDACDFKTNRSTSTDSSIALSRALTDSDIDYDIFRKMKSRSFSDPWVQMKTALDAFPPKYLTSLNSFETSTSNPTEASTPTRRYRQRSSGAEELRLKMEKFFDEECRVFMPDDPGLVELENALQSLDLKVRENTIKQFMSVRAENREPHLADESSTTMKDIVLRYRQHCAVKITLT